MIRNHLVAQQSGRRLWITENKTPSLIRMKFSMLKQAMSSDLKLWNSKIELKKKQKKRGKRKSGIGENSRRSKLQGSPRQQGQCHHFIAIAPSLSTTRSNHAIIEAPNLDHILYSPTPPKFKTYNSHIWTWSKKYHRSTAPTVIEPLCSETQSSHHAIEP